MDGPRKSTQERGIPLLEKLRPVFLSNEAIEEASRLPDALVMPCQVKIRIGLLPIAGTDVEDAVYGLCVAIPGSQVLLVNVMVWDHLSSVYHPIVKNNILP